MEAQIFDSSLQIVDTSCVSNGVKSDVKKYIPNVYRYKYIHIYIYIYAQMYTINSKNKKIPKK